MIKGILKKLRKNEKGQALLLALILLAVGGLIIVPLLGFMGTGLLAARASEDRMMTLYAADAGAEDALWNLDIGGLVVPEGTPATLPPFTINDKTVNVTVENVGFQATYKITSIASGGSGSNTTLEVYARNANLLNNAVTSRDIVTLQPGSSVDGAIVEYYDGYWPTAEEIIAFYLAQVDTSNPYGSNNIDVNTTPVILPTGSLYREGDLEINNSGAAGALGTLNGTIYVTGNLDIGQTKKDFTLDLNNQTIFVEGNIEIGGKTTITGSGAIIALGNIDFAPQIDSDPANFVFIMSIAGTVFMHPNGDFYGALAGDVEVQLQPGSRIFWNDPSGTDFNLPDGMKEGLWKILIWETNPSA